jgi:indolepyruvate ferredoxin oxidoreductase beta subunit
MGMAGYPEGIVEDIKSKADVRIIQAGLLADELGSHRSMNIVLLGAALKALSKSDAASIQNIDWPTIIRSSIKPQFAEVNIKAFEAGYTAAS